MLATKSNAEASGTKSFIVGLTSHLESDANNPIFQADSTRPPFAIDEPPDCNSWWIICRHRLAVLKISPPLRS